MKRLFRRMRDWRWDREQTRLGEALAKAESDPFTYALGLRDGSVVRFGSANVRPPWVELINESTSQVQLFRAGDIDGAFDGHGSGGYHFDRGLFVRLDAIAWVADCPEGS